MQNEAQADGEDPRSATAVESLREFLRGGDLPDHALERALGELVGGENGRRPDDSPDPEEPRAGAHEDLDSLAEYFELLANEPEEAESSRRALQDRGLADRLRSLERVEAREATHWQELSRCLTRKHGRPRYRERILRHTSRGWFLDGVDLREIFARTRERIKLAAAFIRGCRPVAYALELGERLLLELDIPIGGGSATLELGVEAASRERWRFLFHLRSSIPLDHVLLSVEFNRYEETGLRRLNKGSLLEVVVPRTTDGVYKLVVVRQAAEEVRTEVLSLPCLLDEDEPGT